MLACEWLNHPIYEEVYPNFINSENHKVYALGRYYYCFCLTKFNRDNREEEPDWLLYAWDIYRPNESTAYKMILNVDL